jgi:hypothetical protein
VKISRIIVIVVVVVLIGIVALFLYESLVTSAPSTSSSAVWNSAAQYPLQAGGTYGVGGQECVNSSAYIYCIGGSDVNGGPRNSVFSSNPLSSSSLNISSWTTDSSVYPQTVNAPSCVAYSGNVYCIGGTYDDAGDDTAASYYASLNNGVVGSWTATTSYPIPIDTQSCVASSGYVYCVGGDNETGGLNSAAANSTSVWYAPVSSSGIGNWTLTNAYPAGTFYPICYASQGYIYCVGGADVNDNAVDSVYYASLSSSGVGAWTQTTAYPAELSSQACVIISSTIYCVGGEGNGGSYSNAVYFAPVSSSGVGAWTQGPAYPDTAATDCAAVATTVYCIGGFDASSAEITSEVSFATLSAITTTTTT